VGPRASLETEAKRTIACSYYKLNPQPQQQLTILTGQLWLSSFHISVFISCEACEISSSHGREYEDDSFLGHSTEQSHLSGLWVILTL
jgi:hypothetical protein